MMGHRAYLLFAFLFLASCKPTILEDEVIVRVNDQEIRLRDYYAALSTLKPKEFELSGEDKLPLRNLVIKSLVRKSVVLSEAAARNIQVSDEELDQHIAEMKTGYTAATFEESLLERMVDASVWRERVRQNLLMERMFASTQKDKIQPSLKEAHAYYEKNSHLFQKKESVVAAHLVVADRALAEDLRKKIRSRPAHFERIAKENSTGPEAQMDGRIRVERGTLPPELDGPLFSLKIGEISPVIGSPYGFHILKVVERTPTLNLDFEQVRAEILKTLEADARQSLLMQMEEQLIRSARIEYNRNLISKL